MDKTKNVKEALEKVIGNKLDAFLVCGMNDDGWDLHVGYGEAVYLAVLFAELFDKQPMLWQMVNDYKQIKNGKAPDDLVKELFRILGGDDDE